MSLQWDPTIKMKLQAWRKKHEQHRRAAAAQAGNPAAPPRPRDPGLAAVQSALMSTLRALETDPDTIEDAGIGAGEITGWRGWLYGVPRCYGHPQLLHSVYYKTYAWKPGEIEKVPAVADCFGAGLHAFANIEQAIADYGYFELELSQVIFGSVDLWGTVVEHEYGYRAEYAAITSLDRVFFKGHEVTGSQADWLLGLLRRRYKLTSPEKS